LTELIRKPDKRAIGNAVQIFFRDGSSTDTVSIDYPIGHRRRRDEGLPKLREKFERCLRGRMNAANEYSMFALWDDQEQFEQTTVDGKMSQIAVEFSR